MEVFILFFHIASELDGKSIIEGYTDSRLRYLLDRNEPSQANLSKFGI